VLSGLQDQLAVPGVLGNVRLDGHGVAFREKIGLGKDTHAGGRVLFSYLIIFLTDPDQVPVRGFSKDLDLLFRMSMNSAEDANTKLPGRARYQ